MRRHHLGPCLGLRRSAAAGRNAHLFAMVVLLLGGCDSSGLGTKNPDAGNAGQGGTQIGGGGSDVTESSSGNGTGGVAGSRGRSFAGGSTGVGLSSGSAVGGRGSVGSSRMQGSSSSSAGYHNGSSASIGGHHGGSSSSYWEGSSGYLVSSSSRVSSNPSGGIPAGGTAAKSSTSSGTTGGAGGQPSDSAGAKSGGRSGTGGSTSTDGTFSFSRPIEPPAALVPLITSYCAAARHCCSLAGIGTTPLDDCESQFVKHNPKLGLLYVGQAELDNAVVTFCKAAIDKAATSCSAKEVYSVCTGLLIGHQGADAPCGRGGSPMIAGGAACMRGTGATACVWTGDTTNPAVTGTCRKIPHGKKDDACLHTCENLQECSFELMGGPNDTLITLCFEEEGLFCSHETNPPTCQPLVAQGGSCSKSPDACKGTDTCDPVSKTCKEASYIGQSCLYTACQRHLSCGADEKCVEPFWELASEGVSCSGIAQIF